jgi:membrane associated rhomboid family serine protease
MSESAGESGTPAGPGSDARPRDGALDFSSYSIAQLRDLLLLIDAQTQPLNHANLLAEIARRDADAGPPANDGVRGRFTARGGWLGWLEAKRRRSPVYGEGSMNVAGEQLDVGGFQRTWLGLATPVSCPVPIDRVRNVAADGAHVEFEIRRRFWLARRVRFEAPDAAAATALVRQLPGARTSGFERRWRDAREYQARVAALGGWPWSVYALIVANLALFAIMTIRAGSLDRFDTQFLIAWGANFGPATLDGQPWRLLSALFLHADVTHLLANMWVLFGAGRVARQLHGNGTFLGIYFGAGLCASLSSLAWDPSTVSVGASGAIFGVLTAFLAFVLRHRAQLPATILRAHWLSTLVFVVFSIASGMMQAGIDNAAHVGGAISGFAIGWVMARPLDTASRASWPLWRSLAACGFVAAVGAFSLWQVRGLTVEPNVLQSFVRDNAWYVAGEQRNLVAWQNLGAQLASGSVSAAEAERQFRRDIIPFWKDAVPRLAAYVKKRASGPDEFATVLLEFARLREQWANTIADALDANDASRSDDLQRLMNETDRVQAQLERLQLRAQMEYRPRALAHSLFFNRLRALASPRGWKCVFAPAIAGRVIGDDDSPGDSPVMAREIGCRAQRLFADGDYRELDALILEKSAHLNDLPDGTSSLSAIFNSISTQITYGGYELDQLLGRTADWRRAVKDPLMAELVEVLVFQEWAWSARGFAGASEVSAQSWYFFRHRSEIAAAALRAIEKAGQDNPVWHDLAIDSSLDLSNELPQIRAVFDRGVQRFPTYQPLYTRMLRVLMPRWSGSYEKVDEFIEAMSHRDAGEPDVEMYARLYWSYFVLEMDDCNIFRDGNAGWNNLDIGFTELEKRYPRSDYLLNAHAVMACAAGDADTYDRLRTAAGRRMSSSAWSAGWSLSKCDGSMHPTSHR